MVKINPLTRLLICNLGLPIAKVIVSRIENEVKKSPNPYDDIAIDVVKQVLQFVEMYICGKAEVGEE